MDSRKSFLPIACFIAMGFLVAACAPTAPPTPKPVASTAQPAPPGGQPATAPTPKSAGPTATAKPAAEQPRYGGTLPIAASVDPVSFDIHQEPSLGTLEPLVSAYDNLVQYDLRTGQIAPDLAERWEISPDGLAYTFYLRKGVTWHDGNPFSAADVVYSLGRQKDPPRNVRSVERGRFVSVDRFEAPDENTARIVMKEPYVAFMGQFATDWYVIMPKHILEVKGEMKTAMVGTGPFKLKNYSLGVAVEMVKNADYFMRGLPYLDGITHYIVKDGATRFSALRTGRVKLTGHWASLTPSEATSLKASNPAITIWKYPALLAPWHVINTSKPPFDDVRVRQAVSLAYDRQTAIKVVGEGEAELGTFVPPGPWGLSEEEILKLPGYRQPKDADRAQAKKLLAEAGYPDGLKITLTVRTVRLDQKTGEYLKDQLGTIGIQATIELVETAIYNTRTPTGNFQIGTQQNIWRINDPDELGRKFLTGTDQNYPRYSNPKVDQLIAEQARALDPVKRKAIAREMDDILLKEFPSLFPYWADGILATWPEVKNFASPPGMYSSMRNTDLWLAK